MPIYAKITLEQGGTYTQPLDKLSVLLDEIREAAEEDLSSVWHISLVEMTEDKFNALPPFAGY